MGYEGFKSIDNLSSSQMEQDRLVDFLHEKFVKQKQLYQPNPEDFVGVEGFNPEEIKKEIDITKSLNQKWENTNNSFEQKNKKISDVFEGIIVDQFCGPWMGGKAEAFFTSEPDDFIRKVDCVIEFKPEEVSDNPEYLGLGIDVTFSSDYSVLRSKLDDIWTKDIRRGKEVEVKYVDTGNFKGALSVCRVVLAAEKETVHELAHLYKQKDKTEINEHPFLANILSQIKYQLESYYTYARKNKLRADYLRQVTKTLSTFYRVYSEKEAFIGENEENITQSSVFKNIKEYCDEKLK